MRTYNKLEQSFHCEHLANMLSELEPRHYDHGFYNHKGACGTVACALGWASIHHIGGLYLMNGGDPVLDDEKNTIIAADAVFGKQAFNGIFSPFRHEFSDVLEHEKTPDVGLYDSINLLRAQAAMLRDQHEEEVENDKNRSDFIA